MDGFGIAPKGPGNAVADTPKPNLDRIFAQCPGCRLAASGLDVGLPEGQMGNSEVGHTNMGAGRVVFQDLPRISWTSTPGPSSRTPPFWTPCPTAGSGAAPCISWVCCPTAVSTATSTTCSPC